MDFLFIILFCFCSFVIGIFLGRGLIKNDGLFIIDNSDDETTKWILDMKTDPDIVMSNKKEIHLKVKKIK